MQLIQCSTPYQTPQNSIIEANFNIIDRIKDFQSSFTFIGINLDGDCSKDYFADMLDGKMQATKVPNEVELQSTKSFLKKQMKEIMESLYKENFEFIEKAIVAEKNIFAQKGSEEDFELLKNQGGDKILNLLKVFPMESSFASDELQNAISQGDIEQTRMGLQHYIQYELASVGTEFFAFALNFEGLQLQEETKTQIIDSLSLIHSYYHKNTSLDFNGTILHYEGIGENALMGFLVAKINGIEKPSL